MREVRTDVFTSLELSVLLAGEDTEGVSTEVVTLRAKLGHWYHKRRRDTHLGLEKVGGDDLAPVTIEEGKSGGERRGRDTPENSLGVDTPPTGLSLVDGLVEEVIEEQRFEVVVLLVRSGDIAQEDRLDNAATTPHTRNASVVKIPVELEW